MNMYVLVRRILEARAANLEENRQNALRNFYLDSF